MCSVSSWIPALPTPLTASLSLQDVTPPQTFAVPDGETDPEPHFDEIDDFIGGETSKKPRKIKSADLGKTLSPQARSTLAAELARIFEENNFIRERVYNLSPGAYFLHSLRKVQSEQYGATVLCSVSRLTDGKRYQIFLPSCYRGIASGLIGNLRTPLEIIISPEPARRTAKIQIVNN